ncbi:MAG: winged helix-turn-helix transcriptional regulator [Deltaproteobacteria bacterium]|nr:winged helix-turn-helix transcriptional regulator [Deltaproteobacteria bacterium]MBW2416193.1 winged helix-turn-helix transcriptional regulator [Deltaproteobacteria bacterium]
MGSRDAYTAIADPTRREILDLLRVRGVLTAGEIAANFGAVSRPAISRHLRVLKECGVVASRREGKSQNYVLDPKPLADVRDGWLAGFSSMQVASLGALRKRVESAGRPRRSRRRR